MKTQPRPAQRSAPHPLVTAAILAIAFTLIVIALRTTLFSRLELIIIAISFAIVSRWVSRWSANAVRERRERELEQLRRTPVLGLND
jgi:hypothetical protein